MSTLIRNLKEELTGVRKPVDPRGVNHIVMDNRTPVPPYDFDTMQEYEFKVVYSQLITCYPKDLQHVKKNVLNQLTAEIYGEFIDALYSLMYAVNSRDHDISIQRIQDILKLAKGDLIC